MSVDRRSFVYGSIAVFGTGVLSPALNRAMAVPHDHALGHSHTPPNAQDGLMLSWPDYVDRPVDVFSPNQRTLVAAIAETIIPATDTPGAIDAKVPKFIELMFAEWMNEKEKVKFLEGLKDIDEKAHNAHNTGFAGLTKRRQKALLERIESDIDHGWYQLTGPSVASSSNTDFPFIIMMKELTVTGFFMSRVGSTRVLKPNPMGKLVADYKISPGDSSWSARPYY